MRKALWIPALAATLMCGGCVLQGTPSGGLAIDPAVQVVRTRPSYGTATVIEPAPTYPVQAQPIPPPPAYPPPGSPYPPANTYGLPDWTANQ